MIRVVLIAMVWAALPFAVFSQSAQPPHTLDGVWQTGARDGSWGYVQFAPCGTAYCGTLIGGGGQDVNEAFFGTVMVTGMRWSGSEFTDGQLLDVENARTYLSRMRFENADRLRVSGCVLGGIICGGQTWVRVE